MSPAFLVLELLALKGRVELLSLALSVRRHHGGFRCLSLPLLIRRCGGPIWDADVGPHELVERWEKTQAIDEVLLGV